MLRQRRALAIMLCCNVSASHRRLPWLELSVLQPTHWIGIHAVASSASPHLRHLKLGHLNGRIAERCILLWPHDGHQVLTHELQRLLGVNALGQRLEIDRLHIHLACKPKNQV